MTESNRQTDSGLQDCMQTDGTTADLIHALILHSTIIIIVVVVVVAGAGVPLVAGSRGDRDAAAVSHVHPTFVVIVIVIVSA